MVNYSKYPVLVLWNFGYQCNMNCAHCYSRNEDKSNREVMTSRQAESIARKIIESGALHVHFGGGEPLMRKDFSVVAKELTQAGLTVSLSTNGTFLDRKMAGRLASTPVSVIGLSVYGADATAHDSFTNYPGAFNGLVRAVGHLKEAEVKSKLVFILCAKTVSEATAIIGLAERWGIAEVQFYPFKVAGNAARRFRELQLEPAEWRAVYKAIYVTAEKHPHVTVDLGLDNSPVIARHLGRESLPCPCGRYSVVIKPSGDVSACGLAVKVIGNVHQRSLSEIWLESPELAAIRRGEKSPCESLLV
jgi:AdoMet-dependent heme synthase